MRFILRLFLVILIFSQSCKEDSSDLEVSSIYLGWKTESGEDLLDTDQRYATEKILFLDLSNTLPDTGSVFFIETIDQHRFVRTSTNTTPYSVIDFGNGDKDTLRIEGDQGTNQRTIYSLSRFIDFYYNDELQVTWDTENQIATYHYAGGKIDSLPRSGVRGNYLLLLKDSASMADIGFE
jgi:hypothetical protein